MPELSLEMEPATINQVGHFQITHEVSWRHCFYSFETQTQLGAMTQISPNNKSSYKHWMIQSSKLNSLIWSSYPKFKWSLTHSSGWVIVQNDKTYYALNIQQTILEK